MKKIFTHLFAVLLLSLVTTSAWAQFENGKVYRIVCSGTNSVSLGASALTDVAAVSTSETEKAQQWYVTVSGSNYTFRNLANGRYLLGNNSTSYAWGLTETSNDFTVTAVNGNYAIRGASHTNGYGYMHKDGGNNIVSWESSAANSQWTPIEVSYTAEQLAAVWDEVEALVVPSSTVSGYQEKLDAIFSDKACTVLKSEYTSANMSNANLENDENYSALPQVLKDMVKKVRGGDWSEKTVDPADRPNGNNNTNHSEWTVADTWDNDYAKKFRVQMYEPYSVEGEITNYLRINAHCNMDNPTGIYANAGEPMYIMVEGTIADGAELWVAHQVGHGATNYYNNAAYTQLHEGLNVVPYFADGSQLWINYVVHTYNDNEKTIAEKFPADRQLSKYKPLKIHIEGGKINGFFNAMGDYRATTDAENLWGDVDNDADWNYYKARAALSGDFALLGHRQTLLFDFGTWNSTNGYFGVANDGGGIEKALAWHLENIEVPSTPNCYAGSGNAFGNYSDTYYPGMQLSATTGKINIMLEAWDRIQYSEHASLGLLSVANIEKMNALYPRWTTAGEAAEIYNYGNATVNGETKTYKEFCQGIDYSEYFNHHGAAVGSGSGYMSGGWRVCNYHYNTMGSIIGKIAAEAGPTWGPAHEIGHQHQTIFNLNGQTEVTNNFHSNVAVWYMGMGTSRVNGSEGSLSSVLDAYNTDGNDLYTNNIWALTHLYYRLWLYYHLAGNNTQFWPRLFELLRQVPIVNGGQISGETSLLRFYQHACDAAGEDLTEFFRAHGFFELMTDRLVGDYSNGTYNVTEEQIETAISTVKAKNYPVNYAVLLINDGTSETTLKHDGESKRALWDNNPSAEYGSVTDFIEGNTDVTTAYEATVSADGTVTMSGGTGGVGFLILNEKGEIVSFSNKASFEISDEAAYLLVTGKATIVAVDTDSETAEAEVDLSAIQREMLEALIEKIEAMPIDDGTYTHIGFYTKASAAELLAAVESAKTVLASGTGFAAAYELLYTTKEKFVNSPNLSFVPFDPSLTYVITNCAYSGKTMHLNSGLKSATGVDQTANTARWQFKTTDTEGVYKLYNTAGYYLTAPAKSATVGSTATVGDAATFTLLQESPVGAWSISLTPAAEYTTLHDNSYGNVVGWSAGVDPSKWFLTAVEGTNSQATQASDELQALIAKAEALMNEVATVSLKGELQLQADNANSAFFITSNATETGHEPKYLLDNNVSTFFHTVWWGTSPGADHYLQIDLGEEYPVDQFVFEYTNLPTTSNNVDAAEAITVQVANALDNFTTIATLTTSNSNPLPTAKGGTYTSATMGTKGDTYRYIRLIVTDATGGTLGNHYYFGMSEFSLERLNSYSKVKDAYTGHITQDVVATVADKLVDAKTVIANGGDIAAAKAALQEAYDALLIEYNGVTNAKKEELQELIDATNELIAQVGEATVIAGANVDLLGKLYAEREYTAGGTSHSDYSSAENGYNLLDGNVNTHFHSDYNTSTMVSPPYLRVDLGKGNSARKVNFNYTTRNQTGCAPTKINVYGGVAGVEYSQGAIQSSAALNAVTTPTKIVIKNLSGTNSKYFAGASNETDINAAVLVWEPVEDGVAGRYYLRTTDAVSGYIQNGNTTVELGTIDDAQVFVTTSPSTTGADATYFNGESLVNADLDNLVRFVQEGGSTWLNVQHGETGTPLLGHTGKGGWTVHNVYLVTEAESDTPSYDATPIATFTTGDASNPLPTGTSAKWTSADMESTKDYRFFKFEVAESQGSKTENGNTKYYFAISEFGFNIVGEYSVTINPEYQGLVSEELLIETRQEVDAAVTMKKIATSEDLLQAQIDKLQAAYDALEKAKNTPADLDKAALQSLYEDALQLYNEMADTEGHVNSYYEPSALTNEKLIEVKAALDAAKEMLDNGISQTEIDAAKDALQAQYDALLAIKSSDVTGRDELNALIGDMQSLLGEVADKTTAKTALVLQTTDEDDSFYIWSNAKASDCDGIGASALIDKNDDGTAKTGTFFGTVWQGGAVPNYSHYITVDLGTEIALNELSIDYTTRNSTHSNQRPTAIKVLGSNDKEGEYVEITHLSEGMPVGQCVKWEMTSTVALDNYYRYIRFAPATEVGYFNMSDFNLYAHSALVANSNYQPAGIAGGQLYATNAALLDGIAARDKFVTEDNYNAAVTALQAQYDALLAIKNANVSDRTSLEDLITQTNTLIEEVATVSEEEAAIAMQCTDVNAPYYLYCNADGTETNGSGDKLGVTALLDNDANTHLHTTYGDNAQDDNLDHYLRLDMGKNEAMMSFKFSYTGRSSQSNNDPSTMVIEGCNTLDGEWAEIVTLTGLPTDGDGVQYNSELIESDKAYRYIRFMVTKTQNGATNNGHPFFVLSKFSVTACKTIEVKTEYVSPNLPLSTLVTANNEVVDATVIKNQFYVTETVYDTTEEELQAAKDALEAAIALKNIPVILTTDVNNPVLYKIRINRSALKVLAIDDSDAKVPVEDFVRDDDSQSWYFMQGTDDESYEDIHIFPYWYNGVANTTLRLGAASTGDASAAVVAVESTDATNTKQNWYITTASGTEEGWWNIQPEGKTNYFSNNGGIANKMGFWNSASDNGSEFQFLLDGPYTDLSIIFGSVVARQPEYNAPGYYANAADYNAVYDIASGYVTNANGTDEQYTAALDNLIGAETALSDGGRVPSDALEDGAVYRIMNLITNTAAGYEYHYIKNSSATIAFPTTPAVDDNSCLWVCKANEDGTYEFVSALGTLSLGWKEGGETSHAFKIDGGVETGAKSMRNSSEVRMALTNEKHNRGLEFNQASNNNAQDTDWSTDWYFDKIDDADVKFNVNISSRRFSSLYLPYDVEVPEGVGAFTAVAVDGTTVELVRVADKLDSSRHGTVVPARTPVILYIEDIDVTPAGSFEFAYTTDGANLPDDVKANVDVAIIHGHILKTPILCENSYRYYKLGGKSGDTVSKMYWMWKEYGSDGVIADGNAGTDKGGYISCSANKIYMKVAETLAANSFSMRFGADSGTTGIDGLSDQSAKDREIYDLQGRKLSEITEPGIYIVNGKKVHVK